MDEFDLFMVQINIFCNKIDGTTRSDKLKKELKVKFAEIFSEGLGFCSKVKAKFEVKENVMPVFDRKDQYPMRRLKLLIKNLED